MRKHACVDKSSNRTFAAHLIAREFGARPYPGLKIKHERLAPARAFRVERRFILCLQTVQHADDWLLDDDPQVDDGLVCLCHARLYPKAGSVAALAGRAYVEMATRWLAAAWFAPASQAACHRN